MQKKDIQDNIKQQTFNNNIIIQLYTLYSKQLYTQKTNKTTEGVLRLQNAR